MTDMTKGNSMVAYDLWKDPKPIAHEFTNLHNIKRWLLSVCEYVETG